MIKLSDYSSYSDRLPGSCCTSHQVFRVCAHTPTLLHGPLHDRCQNLHSQLHVGLTDRQMATLLSS